MCPLPDSGAVPTCIVVSELLFLVAGSKKKLPRAFAAPESMAQGCPVWFRSRRPLFLVSVFVVVVPVGGGGGGGSGWSYLW